jgi:hypothetical protein
MKTAGLELLRAQKSAQEYESKGIEHAGGLT